MFSVIFDMDGTLLDTQRICIPAWEYAGNKQSIKNMGNCIYDVCGMNEIGWTNYLIHNYPTIDVETFKKDVRSFILEKGDVRFKDGAAKLIEFLKRNKIKLALASSSSRGSIDHHLKAVGAEGVFDVIICGHDVKNGKPAPDIFLLAAKELGVPPDTCFVFEDSANGINAGYRAGMKCIGIPDVIDFDDQTKELLFAHLSNLSQAIPLLTEYI